jgi:hypothetical protein
MANSYMVGVLVVAIVNMILATLMVGLYSRIYSRSRSSFTLGLLVFAGSLLLQNGLVAYACSTMMPLFPDALAPYFFFIGFFETTGLAAMAWTATV